MTPNISRLLVIDDDEGLLYAVRKSLSNSGLEVRIANSGSTGIKALAEFGADAVLLDLKLTDSSGLDVLAQIRALDNELPVIIFTAYSTPGTTIEATQSGAFEYLLKPVDLTLLKDTVKRAINQRRSNSRQNVEVISGQNLDQTEVTIIGSSPVMQVVYKKIGRFAGTSGNVLILGESGTGKDLIARLFTSIVKDAKAHSLRLIAQRFPKLCSKANSSAMNEALSLGLIDDELANLSMPQAVRFFWMRSAICCPPRRRKSCACCRSSASNAWAATNRSRPTFVS